LTMVRIARCFAVSESSSHLNGVATCGSALDWSVRLYELRLRESRAACASCYYGRQLSGSSVGLHQRHSPRATCVSDRSTQVEQRAPACQRSGREVLRPWSIATISTVGKQSHKMTKPKIAKAVQDTPTAPWRAL
jgi:hypothetical protein